LAGGARFEEGETILLLVARVAADIGRPGKVVQENTPLGTAAANSGL